MGWWAIPAFSARARNSWRPGLAIKVKMRVLPFWGIAAPRFPFEKSYSAFILSSLLSRRTTRRDESVFFIPLRPYDHQQFASASQPDRYETSLSLGIRVGD